MSASPTPALTPLLVDLMVAAQLLGLSGSHVVQIARGSRTAPPNFPPAFKVGSVWRMRHADIIEYVQGLMPPHGHALAVAPATLDTHQTARTKARRLPARGGR